MAFGATVRVSSRAGDRVVPVADLYHDDGIHPVRLHDGDVLTDVYLPALAAGWRSAYEKYRVRGSFDFPIVGVAAAARFADGVCTEARLGLQAGATRPLRVPQAEELLRGQRLTAQLLEAASENGLEFAQPLD